VQTVEEVEVAGDTTMMEAGAGADEDDGKTATPLANAPDLEIWMTTTRTIPTTGPTSVIENDHGNDSDTIMKILMLFVWNLMTRGKRAKKATTKRRKKHPDSNNSNPTLVFLEPCPKIRNRAMSTKEWC
jgi:hypothetical protein